VSAERLADLLARQLPQGVAARAQALLKQIGRAHV
jgi:hypothetical protein